MAVFIGTEFLLCVVAQQGNSVCRSTRTEFHINLIGVVVSCVVEVMADRRGQHDQQIDAVHLTPQVSQPDQTVHLLGDKENSEVQAGSWRCSFGHNLGKAAICCYEKIKAAFIGGFFVHLGAVE